MSTNLQWKNFPSRTSSSQDIMESKSSMRNGNDYIKEFPNIGSGGGVARIQMANFGPDCCDSISNYGSSSSHYDTPTHPNRETGIIEKLLHSYGFIQCCERQARLFFHFSQFSGTIEHLKIGDPVEFEMTYDRRTGKPIASTVTKIAPEVVLSEARVTGTVTTELRSDSLDTTGRISYENRGECFFLPYTKDDVEGNVILCSGDSVSFQIATNQRGNLGACHIRLENLAHPVKYQGVVCSMKESFGFIERADVVKEIFFHFSEAKTKNNLNLGDDVEFIIQTRNGKEVACNITRLPSGTVVFEDVCTDITKGQVLKPIDRGNSVRHQNDPLPGRIRYRAQDHAETDVPFGDKDQTGEFTLRHGDWVQFQVATDRRDQLKRATNISLLDESFNVSGERRERGIITTLKDGYGFIEAAERDSLLYFHFTEILSFGQSLSTNDEVEYTIESPSGFARESNSRPSAIRIKHLPTGTVTFEVILEKGLHGVVTKEAIVPSNFQSQDTSGLIVYTGNTGTRKTVVFNAKDVNGKVLPREGDKVIFSLAQVKRTKQMVALNVQIELASIYSDINGATRPLLQGFIAALKDGFGFIETLEHDREIFFHFSNFQGSKDSLELGKEVEYVKGRQASSSGGCCSAELVRLLPKGTIPIPQATDQVLDGYVARAIRALNPDQQQYCGMIETCSGLRYEYGITGLAYKREVLRVGDPVSFQVDTENRATNIVANRKKIRATIDFIHGTFGFLSFEVEDGKKLIFYMSEVRSPPNSLSQGDTVEFVLVTNPRTGKSSACNVTKVSAFDTGTDVENGKDDYFGKFNDSESYSSSNYGQRSYEYNNYQGKSFKNYEYPFSTDYSSDYKRSDSGYNDRTGQLVTRKKRRSTIESIKGAFGFLNVEIEDNKKMPFHMTEVRGLPGSIQPGDAVEYTLVTNQRTGKTSVINVVKLIEPVSTARPERLISRLRTTSLDEYAGPRLVVIREPKGPDGTRGFRPRAPVKPEL